MKRIFKGFVAACLVLTTAISSVFTSSAAAANSKETSVKYSIKATGVYSNWDGVSNVAQFTDSNGNFCFAYDEDEYVTVVRTNNKFQVLKKRIRLEKKHPIFGTVLCDDEGNYYLVTGEENKTDDTSKNTVFISKYNKNGKHIKTVGDNGSSSLAYYYSDDFYTKIPFQGGNCTAAINGNLLTVNYARGMYSGHQSNSIFTINTDTMKEVNTGVNYNSHSFAQRVTAFKDGFVYASEGDCYDRAFTISSYINSKSSGEMNSFHFWVEKGTLDDYDMLILNNNFAHIGNIVNINDKYAALVATSAKSLNSNAEDENEQLFIQIFDPDKNLSSASAYVTSGKRSGTSGGNGDQSVTDYGVKWLTNFSSKIKISNPQAVATDDGKIVILYERTENSKYKGVYYMVLDSSGKFITKSTKFSSTAKLNPCTMPVYSNGRICWAGNKNGNSYIHVFSLEI